ncbi:type VI secretion system tube protein Hcp [Luteolibacter luteus]|uniref:Type VI secretion system tube protein Hcp n=1 Tax=Luteolibacter luteus TaxID=2728835 RepID=A0A858RL05_9BACT|nr:type VI secretion system tube protein Hcp [Luteolibacter luteus]QJE97425.1 type VI secretion system tube protein Hcp [Luteolibacter luteus]
MRLLFALLLLCAAAVSPASAAVDIYIRARGTNPSQLNYTGDSNSAQFPASEGWFGLSSVSFGIESDTSILTGGGTSGGKARALPLSLVKFPNSASAAFFNACTQARAWDEFEIVFTTPGANQSEVTMRIEVKRCFVVELSTAGSGGDDRPMETVKLIYGAQRISFYAPNNQTGKYGLVGQSIWSFTRMTPTFEI